MSRIVFLVLASFLAVAYGQTFGFGGCPAVTVQTPIVLSQISGKWYEQSRSLNSAEATGTCQTTTISINGTQMVVTNKQFDATLNGAEKVSNGTGTVNSTIAKATVKFTTDSTTFNILKTDYTGYMTVSSCVDVFLFHFRNAWTLTRARFPAQTVLDSANAALTAQGVNVASLNRTDQLFCPIFH